MFKRLRLRFIIVAMIAVILVLASIVTAINIFNYQKVKNYADDILVLLEELDGKFDSMIRDENQPPPPSEFPQGGRLPRPMPDSMNEETPYETRYFTVKYKETIIAELGHIASVSADEAIELANRVKDSGKEKGYIEGFRYLVCDNMIIFMDCSRQLDTAKNFLTASILCSLGGAICVFILVFLLSGKAVAPIVEGYEKQKRFVTDAGHELKTPLTIISACNELIELTAGENENTRAIAKQVSKMSTMVKSLSTLASLNEGSAESFKEICVSEICYEICNLFDPVVKKGDRNFEIQIEDELYCTGDASLLRQLLSILLENAGKYAISHTHFYLSRLGKKCCILVSNDATGIKDGDLSRSFERFYRSDEARGSEIEGSGIGLCVAHEIVLLHGGEISAVGKDGDFNIKVII